MGWADNPIVRDLAALCDRHDLAIGVLFGLKADGETLQVAVYGHTEELCAVAKELADQAWRLLENGTIAPKETP